MKKYFLLPAIAIATLTLTNCGKDYSPGPAPEVPAGNYTLQSVLTELAVKPKTVTLDAATGGSFNGNSGTRYVFPANAFRTAIGAAVTGNVEVTVSEYLNKADMLFSGVLPICNGEPLMSGGEISVDVTQAGQPLRMAPGVAFNANMPMPGTAAAGMDFFTGVKDNGVVNWKPRDTTGHVSGEIFNVADTIGISSFTTGFCNADRFMTSPNYQNFTVIANSGGLAFSKDSFKLFTFYDNNNGVWPNYDYSRTGSTYSETHVPDIPVHFVLFGIIKGNFYGGILGETPKTGKSYTVNIAMTTPAAFKAQLKALK